MKLKHRLHHHGFILWEVDHSNKYSLYEKCFGIDHYSWCVVKHNSEIVFESFEKRLAEERLAECVNGLRN